MARKLMELSEADPKGLIRESFKIDGISTEECRSIFMDWALSLGPGMDASEAMRTVLAAYQAPPEHPMTRVLEEGLTRESGPPMRRGGWRARRP